MHLEPWTFGHSPAATNLSSILIEIDDLKLCRSVSKRLHVYNSILKEVDGVKHKTFFAKAVRDAFIAEMMSSDLPEVVKTHACNVMTMRYREALRMFKAKAKNP